MDLISARKLAHGGWVRSPTRTAEYIRFTTAGHETQSGLTLCEGACAEDLDAEDWEPKPAPAKSFEAEVWVSTDGQMAYVRPEQPIAKWEREGWRKIRVREVSSPEESSPAFTAEATSAPAADKSGRKVWSNSKQAFVEGSICRKCGGAYADVWCCSTAMGGS